MRGREKGKVGQRPEAKGESPTPNTQHPIPEHLNTRIPEYLYVLLLLGLHFGLRCVGMRTNIINAKFDEGVYLSLMQGVATGTGALYRDYILCHPPGVVLAGAWLWPRIGGDIVTLRLIYILVCALSLLPMYALARRLYGVRAALLTLFLLATSPGLANWTGQIIILDPLLNILVAFALWGLVPCLSLTSASASRLVLAFLLGALLGLGYLIKETALPIGFALAIALAVSVFRYSGIQVFRSGGFGKVASGFLLPVVFGLGFLLTFGLILFVLSRIPNYLHYTFGFNARDTFDWRLRPYELMNGFYALPFPLTFGVLGVWQMLRHSRSREERFLALYAVVITLIMLFVPRRFYWRYLLPAVPVYCLGVWVWWERWMNDERRTTNDESAERKISPRPFSLVVGRWSFVVLFALVHLVGLMLYRTHEGRNPPEYATALQVLRASPGPLFTYDYLWHAASGHPVTPPVQQLVRDTINVPVTAEEYTTVALQCPTLLLNWETLHWLPKASETALRQRYRSVFRYGTPGDRDYVEILRRPESEGAGE